MTQVRWPFVLLAAVLTLISPFLAALRLKILFSRVYSLPLKFTWAVGYIAALVSLALPFYVGGFGSAYILSKKARVSYSKSFAILFVDFLFGVFLTIILGTIGIYYFYQKRLLTPRLEDWRWIVVFCFTLIVAIFALLILKSKHKKIENLFLKLKDFSSIVSSIIIIKAFLLTVLVAVLGFGASYLYFIAFGLKPPITDFILASSLFGLLGLIPGAPGKIGQYETFGVITLPFLLGLDKNRVFVTLLINHTFSVTAIVIFGLISLHLLNLNFSKIETLLGLKRNRQISKY